MSKLISKMDYLEASFQSIQARGPYKPQVSPQRGRCFEKPYNRYSDQKDQVVEGNSLLETITITLGLNLMVEVEEVFKEVLILEL